MYILNEKFIN